jgi:broad specificity phosphatase PhoE
VTRSTLLLLALIATTLQPLSAQESKGELGIEAARRGGVVIVCRHAMTENTDENETTLRYDDPMTQRRLSTRGVRQAEALGKAFKALDVPIGEAIASPMQRAKRTAELLLGRGRVVEDSAWHTRGDYYGGPKSERRLEQLGEPVRRGNRLIVSHVGTMQSVLPAIRGRFDEGDCVVVRPRGGEKHHAVEVVPWRMWLRTANLDDDLQEQQRGKLP